MFLGFNWISAINLANTFLAFFFFLYLALAQSFLQGLKYGGVFIVAYSIISRAGALVNKSRQDDSLEQLYLVAGRVPPFMLKVVLTTTALLVGVNFVCIWYFLK